MEFQKLLILCPLIFISAILDAIVGSGALISIPTYMLIGLPAEYAHGNNRFSALFGNFTSATRYIKNKNFDLKTAVSFSIFGMMGSFIGAKAVLFISDIYLKYILLATLPVLIFFLVIKNDKLFKNDTCKDQLPKSKIIGLSIFLGLTMGAYGGFLGVGITSFLILVFINVFKLESLSANGNARIVTCCLNLIAMFTFLISGKIIFWIAIPAAISAIIGNYIGVGLAIKNENKIIKPLFIIVFIVLFIQLLFEIF